MAEFAGLARLAGRLAMARLGWSAEQFWAATPAELRWALEGLADTRSTPAAGVDLHRLLKEFPDG